MADRIEAVIFDHTTLVLPAGKADHQAASRDLIQRLKGVGLRIVVFSTHRTNISVELADRGLPAPDLYLTSEDVPDKKAKGSPVWVREAARRLRIAPHQCLYVGDDMLDWRTAISAATLYLHAGWAKPLSGGEPALVMTDPGSVYEFASHYALQPPRWAYALDLPKQGLTLRSLLPASVKLDGNAPRSKFSLQDVFTYEKDIEVGAHKARDLLMFHALSSLYLEGLIPPNALFTPYPSHERGKTGGPIATFLRPASTLFHGYFKDDLLDRQAEAPDTSMERAAAKRERRQSTVSFADQVRTLCLSPSYRGRLEGKTVIVMDDFTTTGMSLEWARNLLSRAGADKIILMTIGKYGEWYDYYGNSNPVAFAAFTLNHAEVASTFTRDSIRLTQNQESIALVQQSFYNIRQNLPLEIPERG